MEVDPSLHPGKNLVTLNVDEAVDASNSPLPGAGDSMLFFGIQGDLAGRPRR